MEARKLQLSARRAGVPRRRRDTRVVRKHRNDKFSTRRAGTPWPPIPRTNWNCADWNFSHCVAAFNVLLAHSEMVCLLALAADS